MKMTRLVLLTVAALAVSSAVASAQTSQKAYVERAPTTSQDYSYVAQPLILGVAY
jgi:hypothetical protein